jgi:hypothetical protein
MKNLLISLALLIAASPVFTQTLSTVTINATGNRHKQIIVDNNSYTIDNTTTTDVKEIVINDVTPGLHTLELTRSNSNSYRQPTKTSFTVRSGYDLTINIASNGSISTSETRSAGQTYNGNTYNGNKQITTRAFNKLYSQTKAKTSSATRTSFLETEFNTSTRLMTAKQASQLIQLVNSESSRLKLAKLSYAKISDKTNFSLVSNLLNSTNNRNELNAYTTTLETNDETQNNNTTAAITDEKFRVIYNEVLAEPTVNDRTYYLNNFFGRDFNFYTSAQAKQFIELVSGEEDRLALAKAAYRGITDRENYNTIYPLLSSYANRSALQTYINSYENTSPRTAMTTAKFDRLYQSVSNTYSSTSRYNTINAAFTTTGNYFTAAQAKKLISLVSGEANKLLLTKAAYRVLVDRSNYQQFNDLLSTTASRNDLKKYVNDFENVSTGGSDIAMSDADFNNLYKKVTGSWSSSSKVQLVSDAFNKSTNYFTTSQVKQLLMTLSRENDRLPLAKNAYDNIVDPANYSQLSDLFTSTAMKNDLTTFAANMQNGTTTTAKIAMPESTFRDMYTQVELTFGFGAKYSRLTQIFNTETNYFTVAQAKQLIQLVSSEKNRLELAKLSYNNITDPENFSQLYNLLSSQASKNELAAYVSSNAYNN